MSSITSVPQSNTQVFKKLRRLPMAFITITVLLTFIGFAVLYSAAQGDFSPWAIRQIARFLIAFPLMILIALIDIRFWFRYAYVTYAFGLLLLLYVEFGGSMGMGAQRWINVAGFTFQPSEVIKIFIILTLARYFHSMHANESDKLRFYIIPAILVALPVALVLIQPNLGTAFIILMIGASMFFMAGFGWKKFLVVGLIGLAFLPVAWGNLHDYQKKRVFTFLTPENDPLGAGYNIMQSKIAIGSGGFTGKGFMQGSQSQLSFLPEKQTDFIFTMLAEEFGFLGGAGVLLLYSALIIIGIKISLNCMSFFGKLLTAGIIMTLFLHVFINTAMVMGLIPVVGVPLPLLSYGGSSMVTMMIGFGFVLNAHVHQEDIVRRTAMDIS